MKTLSPRIACSLIAAMMLATVPSPVSGGAEDEVKAVFGRFVAAQNAHDLKAVGEILQNSPNFLWITRDAQTGKPTPFWGREAALKRFEQFYQGTWKLEPKLDEVRISELSPGVVQLVAPTVFNIAPSGQAASPTLFLLNHIYVKTDSDWKLASIFPILVP